MGTYEPRSADAVAAEVTAMYPQRVSQISQLVSLLHAAGCSDGEIPMVLVSGPPLTGKSTVVRAVLAAAERPAVFVDCRESSTPREIFASVLAQLRALPGGGAGGHSDLLVESLEGIAACIPKDRGIVFIIFDTAERLIDSTLFPVLTRLREYVDAPIGIVLISEHRTETFSDKLAISTLQTVDFQVYSREELRGILERDFEQSGASPEECRLFKPCLTAALQAFQNLTLPDAQQLIRPLWKQYQQFDASLPAAQRWSRLSGAGTATSHCHPSLAAPLSASALSLAAGKWPVPANAQGGKLDLDLPLDGRYVLLASYIAARRPVCAGRAPGGRAAEPAAGKRKRAAGEGDGAQAPQPFALEALLAAYVALRGDSAEGATAEAPAAITTSVLTQISGLVAQGLLGLVGDEVLDAPRYRCLVGAAVAKKLAANTDTRMQDYGVA